MTDTIKVAAPTEDRTPEQAARAAPVSLPAGSYDSAELQKALDDAAKAKNDGKRDELVADAVAKHNEIGTDATALDLHGAQKRVTVVDEVTGVTESRVVFDDKAEAPVDDAGASNAPAAPAADTASKGE